MATSERAAILDLMTLAIHVHALQGQMHRARLDAGMPIAEAEALLAREADAEAFFFTLALKARLEALIAAEMCDLVEQLLLLQEGRLPCGHRRRELVHGIRRITHCAACRREGRAL